MIEMEDGYLCGENMMEVLISSTSITCVLPGIYMNIIQ